MRVTAQSGRYAYLVELDDDRVVVLDIEGYPTLSQPSSRDAVLSRGYWEPFAGDERAVLDLTTEIAQEGQELASVGWETTSPARRLEGVRVRPEQLDVPVVTIFSALSVLRAEHDNSFFVGEGFVWPEEVGAK